MHYDKVRIVRGVDILEFSRDEIEKIKEVIKPIHPNLESPIGRGQELSFQKETTTNNFYFVVKKLSNKSDSSGKSIKYGVWYVAYTNDEDLKSPTTVYYRLSDAVNLQKNDGKSNTIEMLSKLADLINASVKKINL